MPSKHDEKPLLSIREVAALLGRGVNQTYEAARTGQLPTVQIGARRYVPRHRLNQLLGIPETTKDDLD